jgi:hypothetical protein
VASGRCLMKRPEAKKTLVTLSLLMALSLSSLKKLSICYPLLNYTFLKVIAPGLLNFLRPACPSRAGPSSAHPRGVRQCHVRQRRCTLTPCIPVLWTPTLCTPELGTPTLSYIWEFFKAKLFANIADEASYKISRSCSSECQGELLEGMNEGRCLR